MRLVAWVGGVFGVLLLVWPVSPRVPLWDLPGVFGGGNYLGPVVSPLTALLNGTPLVDWTDRLQLAAGLLLLGLAAGIGFALVCTETRHKPKPSDESIGVLSGYQP